MYPAREASRRLVNPVHQPSNDVSPWPQADRVNLTQGELAEDRKGIVAMLSRRLKPISLS